MASDCADCFPLGAQILLRFAIDAHYCRQTERHFDACLSACWCYDSARRGSRHECLFGRTPADEPAWVH